MDNITAKLAASMPLELIQDGVWREVAEQIGINNMFKVLDIIGGATVYIPKVDTIIKPVRDAQMQKEFNGYNHSELARKYNLAERTVREICGAGYIKGQMSIFDFGENP